MSDLISALNELRDARHAYEEAGQYYEGDVDEKFNSSIIAQLLGGQSNQDFDLNLARKPVTSLLDRLKITAVACANDADTALLKAAVWDANELDLEAPEVHEATLSLGDGYLFVWPSEPEPDTETADRAEDDQPEVDGGTLDGQGVDVFFNSPLSVRVIYDPEHPRKKMLAIKSWCETSGDDELTRVNLYYPDRIEKWISKAKTDASKDSDFEAHLDEHTNDQGVMPNPWGVVPFFHFRTRRQYGRPEHKDAYGPQNAVKKLAANQMTASDFAAFPQRWGLLDAGATSDDDIDSGWDESSTPEDRPSQMVSRPGAMWILKNYKSVGEFGAADARNFLDPMMFWIRGMSTVTGTPLHFLDPSGDVPSGESQRAAESPLTTRGDFLTMALGATWVDMLTFAMRILGRPDAQVTVRWAPTTVTDDLQAWQTVIAKQQAGIPVRYSLMEIGYTAVQCDTWGYTEQKPDGEMSQLELQYSTRQTKAGK